MALPGQLTVTDALARAPASADKTNIATDLAQLLTDLNTAVTNGRLKANVRDVLFYDMLLDFGQRIGNELTA